MILSLKSVRGGNKMAGLLYGRSRPNITIEPEKKPEVIEDYFCWKIGYDEKGEHVYIKPSDAVKLSRFLKKQVGT